MRSNLSTVDTIFALASGSLPTAVAVEKISGPLAFSIFEKLFRTGPILPTPGRQRGMWFGKLVDIQERPFDECLALFFPAPRSHTGDDVLEFHCHGSRAIIRHLEAQLLQLGARPAVAGEFSYRSLINGKQTADQLEQLSDLFSTRSIADLFMSKEHRAEALARSTTGLRERMMEVQAILDTAIDFSEEYSAVVKASQKPIAEAIHACHEVIQGYRMVESGSLAPRIVLFGRPNAGKSSLFNALLGRKRALVSALAGTTRDVIEEDIEINGREWKLVDTAGLRKADGEIELLGIGLGKEYLAAATAAILVIDGTETVSDSDAMSAESLGDRPLLVFANKSDSSGFQGVGEFCPSNSNAELLIGSATSGLGLEKVAQWLERLPYPQSIASRPTTLHISRLEYVAARLTELERAVRDVKNSPEELAELSRLILARLGDITGPVSHEEVLGKVFSQFCIGK